MHKAFTPHGYCLMWDWDLILPMILSDALMALAFFIMPALLIKLLRSYAFDPLASQVIKAFAAFIFTCGLTHVMDIVTLWQPWYVLQAWIDIISALAAMITAILLAPSLGFLFGTDR